MSEDHVTAVHGAMAFISVVLLFLIVYWLGWIAVGGVAIITPCDHVEGVYGDDSGTTVRLTDSAAEKTSRVVITNSKGVAIASKKLSGGATAVEMDVWVSEIGEVMLYEHSNKSAYTTCGIKGSD